MKVNVKIFQGNNFRPLKKQIPVEDIEEFGVTHTPITSNDVCVDVAQSGYVVLKSGERITDLTENNSWMLCWVLKNFAKNIVRPQQKFEVRGRELTRTFWKYNFV